MSADDEIALWDRSTGALLQTLDHARGGGTLLCFAIAPLTGDHVVTASFDEVFCWRLAAKPTAKPTAKPKLVRSFTRESTSSYQPSLHALACSETIAAFGDGKRARRFDLASGKELAPLKGHRNAVYAVALSADGRFALSCGEDDAVKLQDCTRATPKVIATFRANMPTSCGFSPPPKTDPFFVDLDGVHLIRDNNKAELLPATKGATSAARDASRRTAIGMPTSIEVRPGNLALAYSRAKTIAFAPDGETLVCANEETTAPVVFDLATEQRVLPNDQGHVGRVTGLVLLDDERTLVSAANDGFLHLWDLETGKLVERLGPYGRIRALAAMNRTSFVIGTQEGLRVINVRDGSARPLPFGVAEPRVVTDLALVSPEWLALDADWPGKVFLLSKMNSDETWSEAGVLATKGHATGLSSASDGRTLFVLSDETISAIDVATKTLVWTSPPQADDLLVTAFTFAAENNLVAAGSWEFLNVFGYGDRANEKPRTYRMPSPGQPDLMMTMPGRHGGGLVIVSRGNNASEASIDVWNIERGKIEARYEDLPRTFATALVGAADGRMIYVGTSSGAILELGQKG